MIRLGLVSAAILLWADEAGAQAAEDSSNELAKSCKKGDAKSCNELGVAIFESDPAEAARLFKSICEKGLAIGCDNFGLMTAQGKGVEASDTKALSLFTKACSKRLAVACLHAAAMYFDGFGVEQDFKRTTEFYVKACDYGAPDGCERAAHMYESAPAVGLDPKKTERFNQRAAALRSAQADAGTESGGWVIDAPSVGPPPAK